MKQVGSSIYGICEWCGKMVKVNKMLFGSAHFCTTEEERRAYPAEIQTRVQAAQKALEAL